MKTIAKIILILSCQLSFGQQDSLFNISEIEQYSLYVDSLNEIDQGTQVEYPDMSHCGGHLIGFYTNDTLIFLTSTYSAEVGFTVLNAYFHNGKIVKIDHYKHTANWDEYYSKSPNGETENGSDYDDMTFSDTTMNYYLTNPPVVKVLRNEVLVDDKLNIEEFDMILKCIKSMTKELESVKDE